ncbi:TolC family protein (plasmid) [Mucilaginibacter robiniae]|uniref:TolC family protein n=2 Tax=Mucilaginibacter TaxID=423349 RepID=A0A7L5E5Q4_9SPHI|nr:TolC family protein [Mucilaginibacter robiniae]QJD98602.1 TolC family protein [Mucilaginibacter robiniae]
MSSIKKSILVFVSLLSAPAAFSQNILSLDSIIARIDQQNANLRAYTSRAQSQVAKSQGSTAQMAPMIGAGTWMTPYPGTKVMDETDKGAWMLSAEQDITNPAKLRRKQAYENSLAAVELEGRNVALNDVRTQAKKLYYGWLVASKKMSVLKENERILTTLNKLAKIRYPYNKATLSSVYSAEGRLAEVQNMQLMTEADMRKKMYQLNTLMNRPASSAFAIDTAYQLKFIPVAVADTAYLSSAKSVVRQMDKNISSMNLNIDAMKAEAKPDFRLRLDNMFNRAPMMPTQFTAMAMVSIPIAPWSSKMYKSGVKSMQYSIEAMRNERQAMLIETENMVASMLTDITTMQRRLKNFEQKILPALQKSFDANRIAYEENTLALPQVMTSWETYNMNRMNYLDELQAYYLMTADYEKEIEKN